MIVKEQDRVKLAAETGFSPRTIAKWATGKPVHNSTDKTLKDAAKRLRIDLKEGRS